MSGSISSACASTAPCFISSPSHTAGQWHLYHTDRPVRAGFSPSKIKRILLRRPEPLLNKGHKPVPVVSRPQGPEGNLLKSHVENTMLLYSSVIK